ncbi:MAG: glutamate--tRNA ligase [Myxococcota bacterium]|nr:glutamate--tRNA ligase [Myxococcota bacterium]
MTQVRVRFAPSPTGVLHLGGARTALFNWLWARHTGGKFLLRIEDTDRERSTEESARAIADELRWLGLDWDEDPVIQSSRLPEHIAALEKLIQQGRVYKCYCTPQEREAMREQALAEKRTVLYDGRCDGKPDDPTQPFVWRFRMPRSGETVFDDLVMGRVVTPNAEIEDIVIARSDGSPLYNFVVVIDDAFMGITHVIRGKDHLTNTPKQIQIYQALGLSVPQFGHLPLILGLSKRLRSAGIGAYQEQGYLRDAVNNYIARLGWSHGDKEIFSQAELVELFDLANVNRSEGALNLEKMEWINQQHLQACTKERLAELTQPFLAQKGVEARADARLAAACETRRTKCRTLVEMADSVAFYFVADEALTYEEAAAAKHLVPRVRELLAGLGQALSSVPDWSEPALQAAVSGYCDLAGIKLKEIAQPARVAFTGSETGPGLYEMMVVLGKTSTVARLERASRA